MKTLIKTIGSSRSGTRWRNILGVAIITVLVSGVINCGEVRASDIAQQAYELRLQGKVDEAKALLDKHLEENPKDAMAYYELARLYDYTMTSRRSGRAGVMKAVEDMEKAIQKATELEPNNVIYRYFAAKLTFLKSYIALQQDQGNAKEHVAQICKAYEGVLELKPDYGEVLLGLVEMYGALPEEMGADKAKAEKYAKMLEEIDLVMGAKARAMMLPEDADLIGFWEEMAQKHPDNSGILEALGKAYLYQHKVEEGTKNIELAIKANPDNQILLLDLARYHGYSIMEDESKKETAVPLAEEAVTRYLESDPIAPIKAYSIAMLARFKSIMGKSDEGKELRAKAEEVDPYVSAASAIPHADLFVPPDEIPHNHAYLFRPF